MWPTATSPDRDGACTMSLFRPMPHSPSSIENRVAMRPGMFSATFQITSAASIGALQARAYLSAPRQ